MTLKILSLFDGMSCGQLSLKNLNIELDSYFSSEIDKYAMQVAKENFPNTIHIGDVTKVKGEDYNDITLLLGGSPCQGFSFAGKQLNFKDHRSALFFEYVRILKEVKPKYFLLENVRMKKEYQDVISEHLFGIQPILLDSAKLTAQSRKRLYWVGELQEDGTYKQVNIGQPEDRKIYLKDILEDEVDEKYYLKETQYKWLKDFGSKSSFGGKINIEKASCLLASYGKVSGNGGKIKDNKGIRMFTELECERLQGVSDNYTSCVSNSQRYKMLGNGWTIPVIEWILLHLDLKPL